MQHAISLNKFDILCFSETWLASELDCDFLNGYYNVFQCNRESRGGGVVILCKNIYHCVLLKTFQSDGYEGVVVNIGSVSDYVSICCIYRAPTCDIQHSLELHEIINDVLSSADNFILIGDFNYQSIDWHNASSSNVAELSFLNVISDLGGTQLVVTPTRNHSILDLLITSSPHLISDPITVGEPFSGSDHNSIIAKVCFSKPLIMHAVEQWKYMFQRVNYELLHDYLRLQDWSVVYSNSTPDYKWDFFIDTINNIIHDFVPKKLIKKKSCYRAPWCNAYLRRLYAKKKRLWCLYRRSLSMNVYARYNACSLLYKSECVKAKLNYEKALFNNKSKRPSAFYNYTSRAQCHATSLSVVKRGDNIITDSKQIANNFGEYFSSVFVCDDGVLPVCLPANVMFPDNAMLISSDDVILAIRSLKSASSPGSDGIPGSFIKNIACHLARPMSYLFNSFLASAYCPQSWKMSHVIPIYKGKGEFSSIENYRPISLISCFSKVFEKIVCNHIMSYVTKNNILSDAQFGFVPGKSISDQMLCFMSLWDTALMHKLAVHVVYFDLSKAFDTVSHAKLLYKLNMLGIHPQLCSWLKSYLSDRSFRVKVNGIFSDPFDMLSGVPQGSTLGPLLFILYTNDLPLCVKNCMILLFADDCKLAKCITNDSDMMLFQSDIDRICKWYKEWQLTVNVTKSFFMSLYVHCDLKYIANDSIIPFCDSVKDLGIIYSSSGDFQKYIFNVVKQAKYSLHRIFCTFKYHSVEFYLNLYNVYVRPLLECNTPVWSPSSIMLINFVEDVQRKFTRRLLRTCVLDNNLHNMSYVDRLLLFKLKSLEERRIIFDILQLHRVLHVCNYDKLIPFFVHYSSARYVHDFCNLYCRTSSQQNLWFYRVIHYWNSLPFDVKLIQSHSMFKSNVLGLDFSNLLKGIARV